MLMRAPITAKMFEKLAAEAGPCELERGEIVAMSPGGFDHSETVNNAAYYLTQWAKRTRLGRVVSNEAGVVTEVNPDTVRGADVAYVSYARLARHESPGGFMRVAPNLIVEVVGKRQGWKKVLEKAAEYMRMGTDRVWVVNPKTRTLVVLRPDQEPVTYSAEDTITDPLVLPRFRCRVARFFES